MATLALGGSKELTKRAALTENVTEVTLIAWVDNPDAKTMKARIKELPNPVTVWEAGAYDAAGDWTEAEARAELIVKVNAL